MADQDQTRTQGQQDAPQPTGQSQAQQDQAKRDAAQTDQTKAGGFSGDVSGQAEAPKPFGQVSESTGANAGQGSGLQANQTGQGQQDTDLGPGVGQANLGAQGQTGVLGQAPAQTQGQPKSPTTGGPDLSQGLKDQNTQGGGV